MTTVYCSYGDRYTDLIIIRERFSGWQKTDDGSGGKFPKTVNGELIRANQQERRDKGDLCIEAEICSEPQASYSNDFEADKAF